MPRGAKPVEVVEVSERNFKLRVVLLIITVAIALSAFGYAIYTYFNNKKTPAAGWHTITAVTGSANSSHEFVFSYDWDQSLPASEYNRLKALYTDTMIKVYELFDLNAEPKENLSAINLNVNEEITIDPVLYRALSHAAASGTRYLYMAPLFADYKNTFFGNGDAPIVEEYDPYLNSESAAYYEALSAFARDSSSVELQLLGENRVCLYVSDAYASFAEEHGISVFLDLFRIKNAFIVDYVAELFTDSGFTCGSISSYDGFVRNLDTRDVSYSYNLFDRIGNEVGQIARLSYTGATSIVYLRSYPLGELDSYFFYLTDKKTIPPYIDIADGKYRTALDSLISVSSESSCADIVLSVLPFFVSDTLDAAGLAALSADGIHSVYNSSDNVIYYTDVSVKPAELISYPDANYISKLYE